MTSLRVRYQTIEFGDTDIHVRTLRNRQEYSDSRDCAADLGICSSSWSLFGVIWASGELLARLMYDQDIEGLRILEVGCGIGLASLVLNSRLADITATDHHPEAGRFLSENVKLNKGAKIPFVRTGWADEDSGLGKFDLIIGSDLLYERDHAALLSEFIDQHAKEHCEVILVDPGRTYRSSFSKKMTALGYACSNITPPDAETLTQPARNALNFQVLRCTR